MFRKASCCALALLPKTQEVADQLRLIASGGPVVSGMAVSVGCIPHYRFWRTGRDCLSILSIPFITTGRDNG